MAHIGLKYIPNLSKFQYSYGILKRYNYCSYKLIVLAKRRRPGYEEKSRLPTREKGTVNESKLQNSLSRTKSTIYELAACNPWDLFVTFTLDKNKYDRTNLPKFQKDLSQFIRDFRKKTGAQVKYMLIPEQHKDGCWHMHGFLMGLKFEHLHEFQSTEHLPYKILNRLAQGKHVFDWPAYSKKFGFSDIELIENNDAASKYITKYITKEAMSTIKALNAHVFYASKGLRRAKIIRQGTLAYGLNEPDFRNDYCAIRWFDNIGEPSTYFSDPEYYFDFESEVNEPLPCLPQTTFSIG